jgi:cytochrome P450
MQSIDDVELPLLPLDDPALAADPFPHFAAARAHHPWLARWQHGPIVTGYQAVRELMKMESRMRTPYDQLVDAMGARGTAWGRFQEGHILSRSGSGHKRMRDILAPAFTPRQANLHRPLMRRVIAELLEQWVPKAAFDFEEFASYFPITVTCTLIGASPAVIPQLRSSMEALGLSVSMNPAYLPQLEQAIGTLDAFVHQLMQDRRKLGGKGDHSEDLLDLLLQAQDEGGLSERELADLLIFLFVAGFDTSKNVLTLAMFELLSRREMYRRCAEDITFCGKVIDETMRFHSVTTTNRLLCEDIVYRDVLLPAGTSLWFPWSVIARDPEAVENADDFQPERAQANPHLGFALGAHMCLGQFIARAQLEEGLHQIARRLGNPRSTGPRAWRPFPGVWGIAGLPITFDPQAPEDGAPNRVG